MKQLSSQWPLVFLLLVALTASGCSGGAQLPQAGATPETTPREDSGPTTAPSESDSPAPEGICSLFTTEEIEELLGVPVSAGQVAGPLGTACQWDADAEDDVIYAQIQVLKDLEYWSNPKLAPGYEALDDIGNEAYVVPDQPDEGCWNARALTDSAMLSVVLSGGKADRDGTVKLLRMLLNRLK